MTEKLEQMLPALETATDLNCAAKVAVLAYADGLSAAAKLIAAKEGKSDE